jgi:hypothetical protein
MRGLIWGSWGLEHSVLRFEVLSYEGSYLGVFDYEILNV